LVSTIRFDADFEDLLPETSNLLKTGGFQLHPAVTQVTLHGSRGLAKSFHDHSDLDLCLKVDLSAIPKDAHREVFLREVLETTLSAWKGNIELDLAAAFDTQGCELSCLNKLFFEEGICQGSGTDCLGLYKIQKGLNGLVTSGVEVKKMYPCLVIWKK